MTICRIFFGFILILLFGCSYTQQITYSLATVTPVSRSSFSNFSLTVKPFEDIRNPILRKGAWDAPAEVKRFERTWYYNSEDHYKNNTVTPWISKQIARHINASHLFKKVREESEDAEPSDFILEGKIKEFDAFKQFSAGGSALTPEGMKIESISDLLSSFSRPTEFEATTLFVDVKLIKVSSQEVVWQGNVFGHLKGENASDSHGWTVYQFANESLKMAIENLISVLESLKG